MKLTRNERGFTLIELMVVLIIIGILAAIAIPTLSKQSDKAKTKRALGELRSMKTIVDVYMNDASVNPAGLAPGETGVDTIGTVLKNGGITSNDKDDTTKFNDPWGAAYNYSNSGTTYKIWSNGSSADNDAILITESSVPTEGNAEITASAIALP